MRNTCFSKREIVVRIVFRIVITVSTMKLKVHKPKDER